MQVYAGQEPSSVEQGQLNAPALHVAASRQGLAETVLNDGGQGTAGLPGESLEVD